MTRRFPAQALAVLAMISVGCGPGATDPGPLAPELPALSIADAVNSGGNEHFFWLPPLVASPASFNGAFDAAADPSVEICEWVGAACVLPLVASYTTASGSGSETVRVDLTAEHYVVNWHTDDFALDPTATYRIRVFSGGAELGHADVDVVSSGKELKNVDTDEYIALKDGRTLPIKFRIEEGASDPVCVAAPAGMVAWWTGDSDATDLAGSNNGVLHNGATAGAPGFVDGAFSFDGVNDYLNVASTFALEVGNQFTIDAWFNSNDLSKIDPGTGTATQSIIDYGFTGNDGEVVVLVVRDAVLELVIRGFGPLQEDLVGSTVMQDATWYHAAATFDGTTAKLYLNGVLEDSRAADINLVDDVRIQIGRFRNSAFGNINFHFDGRIDEVEIFDRALSQAEIQALFDAGSAGKCKP